MYGDDSHLSCVARTKGGYRIGKYLSIECKIAMGHNRIILINFWPREKIRDDANKEIGSEYSERMFRRSLVVSSYVFGTRFITELTNY